MSSTQTTWPEGVIARYLTVGTATVDMTTRLTRHNPPEPFAFLVACSGCPETKEISHYRLRSVLQSWEEHDPAEAEEEAREFAQTHAEKCRAMPRPAAA
ncbi:hypothetical protein ACH4TE_19775 [Streptomyces sioyaensis]|uniref:hypothetical protein n=1 Tax=Streptomyces sioyaensis TaxID=67364 RepID=UPI0037A6D2A5